jgi:hypothetical protein
MTIPHLHLFHPPESVAPHLITWMVEVESRMRSDPSWDGCRYRRVPYDNQAGFNVTTEVDRVRRNLGPAIFIQKVQAARLERFRQILEREVSVYSISVPNLEALWNACEEARRAFEDGEPRIPLRELIAYLIVAKLAKHGFWGGTSLNKNFLWCSDLPKGGFPKTVCSDRDIQQVADALCNAGILSRKTSQGRPKIALGERATVQNILENRSFANVRSRSLQNYFARSPQNVPARLLSYNEGLTDARAAA